MKKILIISFAFVLLLGIAGCGKKKETNEGTNNNKQQEQSVELKDATTENWASAVKSNFMIDVELPEGWKVEEITPSTETDNLRATFKAGGTTTSKDFAQMIYDESRRAGQVSRPPREDSREDRGMQTWEYRKGRVTVNITTYYDNDGNFEITLSKR